MNTRINRLGKCVVFFSSISFILFTHHSLADVLEEIVVTAQKREQNIHDVPFAINVLDGDQMENLQMTDSLEIINHVAGLMSGGTLNKTKPMIFLRGVGNSDFQTGSSSPVAVYVDDIFSGSNFGITSLLVDLERVEVLKGPQGTLWGRNTTAGLVNFVPNKADPGDPINGHASLSYGEFGDMNAQGAIGFPISDQVAGRIAANYNTRDGVFEAIGPGFTDSDFAGWDWIAARGNLVFEPNDQMAISATVSFSEMNGSLRPAKALGTFGAGCSNPGELGTTCGDVLGFVSTPDIHEVQPQADTFEDVESFGADIQITYDIGSTTLTSITAYSSSERQAFDDTDYSPSPLLETSYEDGYDGFSQEIRLASNSSDGSTWVLGVYYYTDELEFYRGSVIPLFGLGGSLRSQIVETDTAAIFGEVSYQVTDRLEVTGGLRWTTDKRTASIRSGIYTVVPQVFDSKGYAFDNITDLRQAIDDQSRTFDEPSGRISFVYNVSEDVNVWGTLGRGFKGGDSNSGSRDPGSFNISEPEFVTSLETGLKTRMANNTVSFDISGFYYDYEDKQVFTEIVTGAGNVTILSNAGALTIYGLDVRMNWLPTNQFSIDAGLAYTNSEFDDFLNPGTGVDQSGNTTAYTPEFNFDAIARYTWPLGNGGSISVQADAVFTDDVFFTNDNLPFVAQDAYWLVGGFIGYTTADERWDFRLWGKNLTDEEYFVGGFDFTFIGPYIMYPGDPRIIGISANFKF